MSADPNILHTQTPDKMDPTQAPPSVESIQLPGDHAGNHPDPTVREVPRQTFSTSLADANKLSEDEDGRQKRSIYPTPDSVAGLPEANNVTQVTDPHTGVRRFVVAQTTEADYVPPAAPEKKSRKGLWAAAVGLGTAAVAGLVVLFHGGGNAEQVANSDQGNQGDTKATSQAAAPTATEASPTSAAETQEAPAGVNYTIDTVSANADPEKYYAGYAAEIGMEYADSTAMDEYVKISDAGKNGEVDQAVAGDQMKAFLTEQLGGNFTLFANALYKNPDLTPKEQADLVEQLAPYVFDTDKNANLQAALKQFAAKVVAAAPAGGSLESYFNSGSSIGTETTTFVGVFRRDENGQPDNNFYGPELLDSSGNSIYFVGRPGFTDGTGESHFSLRDSVK